MKKEIIHQNLSSKLFTPFLLIVFYWFYTSISFGYFLSKNFYNVFDTIHKNNLSKRIQLTKKFHFKTIIKTIIDFSWKSIQNWLLRIFQKSLLLIDGIDRSLKLIQIFFNKVLKSPFRFKRNFRLFTILNECLFFHHTIAWLSQWRNHKYWIDGWKNNHEKSPSFINVNDKCSDKIILFLWVLVCWLVVDMVNGKNKNQLGRFLGDIINIGC